VAAVWPGGAENAEGTGLDGWIWCFAQMVRLMGRSDPARETQALDAALARQLAAQPLLVPMSDGETRGVYPKSYHALRFLDTLDRETVLVLDRAAEANVDDLDGSMVVMLAPLAESLAVRLWMWVLTHPEPGLPFDDAGEMPDLPEWTKSVKASDVLALARAHAQVNHHDLQTIAAAFPQTGSNSTSRLTLAGFIGTSADSLGVRPFEVMRRWSLGELFAQRVTAAEAQRAAYESAKQRPPEVA
jgi:hypothetical protein